MPLNPTSCFGWNDDGSVLNEPQRLPLNHHDRRGGRTGSVTNRDWKDKPSQYPPVALRPAHQVTSEQKYDRCSPGGCTPTPASHFPRTALFVPGLR